MPRRKRRPSEQLYLPNRIKLSRNAGDSFTPLDLTNLARWIDFTDTSSLTITSGPDIDAVLDKSPNGRSYAQTTASKKPHTGATLNGLNGANFDGADDSLTESAGIGDLVGDKGTFFMVCRPSSISGNPYPFSVGRNLGNFWSAFQIADISGNDRLRTSFRNGGSVTLISGSTNLVMSTAYIFTVKSTGTAYSLRVNGNQETLSGTPDDGSWIADLTAKDHSAIGCLKDNNESNFFNGDIFEIIYIDDLDVPQATIDQVEDYMSNRFAITLV